ncbi:MAG: autotransporter outer membrane beta-barrel domain-containing protein, partial [Lactobacillus sp.]|nr:autotransporter outer membrane beta-barrel domain-containing protein [Lactobacillus sp.]
VFEKNQIKIGNTGNVTVTADQAGYSSFYVSSGSFGEYISPSSVVPVIQGGIINFEDSYASFGEGLYLASNGITIGNTGNTVINKAVNDAFSGDMYGITGGVMRVANSTIDNFNIDGDWYVTKNTVKTGNTGNATSSLGSAQSGDIYNVDGGMIALENVNLAAKGDTFITSNTLTMGNTGNATGAAAAVSGSIGDVYGGIIKNDSGSAELEFFGVVAIDKNVIKQGKTGNATATSSAVSGDVEAINGGILYSASDVTFGGGYTSISGNTITQASTGNAVSKQGNAVAGNVDQSSLVYFTNAILSVNSTGSTPDSQGNVQDILIIADNKVTGGAGGNANGSAYASAGNGGDVMSSGLALNAGSVANIETSALFSNNVAVAGKGGNATSAGVAIAGKGGNAYAGALYVEGSSSANFTGEQTVFVNNKVTSGKGGKNGSDGDAYAGALYVGDNSTVTFGNGTDKTYVLFQGNKANNASSSMYIDSTSQVVFDLSNDSLAEIKDSITGEGSLINDGGGALLVYGDHSKFDGTLKLNGGIFGIMNESASKAGTFNTRDFNITDDVALAFHVNPNKIVDKYMGTYMSSNLNVTGTFSSSSPANEISIIPVGIQNQKINDTYSYKVTNVDLTGNFVASSNSNASVGLLADGTLHVERYKNFSEAFTNELKSTVLNNKISYATIDSYIKTLSTSAMLMFDEAFVADDFNTNLLTALDGVFGSGKKKKLVNEVSVLKTGLRKLEGAIDAYFVGTASFAAFGVNDDQFSMNSKDGNLWMNISTDNGLNSRNDKAMPSVVFGFDRSVNDELTVGFAMQTYDGTYREIDASIGNTDRAGVTMGLYSMYRPNSAAYVSATGLFDYSRNGMEDSDMLKGRVNSNYSAQSYMLATETGYDIGHGLTPFMGFEYAHYNRNGYNEKTSAGSALSYNDMTWDTYEVPVGMRFTKPVTLGESGTTKANFYMEAAYAYNFGDVSAKTTAMAYGNGNAFSYDVTTEEMGRSSVRFKTGFNMDVSEKSKFNFGYQAESRDNYNDHFVSTEFRYNF